MIFNYREYMLAHGVISRPVVPVTIHGPTGSVILLGLLDTGADTTVLPSFILAMIGAKYHGDKVSQFRGVGGQLVSARHSSVELSIGQYRWPATVGLLDGPQVAILGYRGFLQYFNTTFNSDPGRVILRANKRLAKVSQSADSPAA